MDSALLLLTTFPLSHSHTSQRIKINGRIFLIITITGMRLMAEKLRELAYMGAK